MIHNVKLVLLLLVAVGLGGCGGGTRVDAVIEPDPIQVLARQGLVGTLETDKAIYQVGETVHCWVAIRNNGTRTHTLELRPDDGGEPHPTYQVMIVGGNPGDQKFRQDFGYDAVSCTIAPGQTVRVVETQWDQKIGGLQADAGDYDIHIGFEHFLVDGKELSVQPPEFGRSFTIQ